MNTKFILKTGEFIYPAYLDKTHRLELKNKFGNGYGYMRCGCRPDENLFYRISEDGKIYPDINYWIPTEDDIVGAIISKAGESKKLLLFFKSSKVMPVYMDMSLYTPILIKNAEELNYNSLSAVF